MAHCLYILQLFDMKKFQQNVNRELRRAYPDRRRLECQCLSAVAFVKSEPDLLDCPIWVLIINIVAMDMLKSKLPPGTTNLPSAPKTCDFRLPKNVSWFSSGVCHVLSILPYLSGVLKICL